MTKTVTKTVVTKTVLITGASGFLGWYLCQEAQRQGWTVHGTAYRHPIQMPGVTMHRLDLTDFDALRTVMTQVHPDAVIHTAAQARPNLCETEPEAAYHINVTASLNLAGLCSDRTGDKGNDAVAGRGPSIPCVFISTNQVFDGTQALYREDDPVSPINVYGEQKVAAEEGMLARHPGTIICRMPLMFGAAPAPSFLQGFLQRLAQGEPLKLFTDEFRTPVNGTDAAKGILLSLDKGEGRVHLGGAQRLSRYEFGQILVDTLGIDASQITACRQADMKMAAARAPDLAMDSSRAFQLGYAPETVQVALERLAVDGALGYPRKARIVP